MILGQLTPYVRTKTGITSADQRGAAVARHDLVRATLRYGDVEGVHFFLPEGLLSSEALRQPFLDLQEEFPDRSISIADLRTLETLAAEHQYIFVEPFVSFPRLGHLRQTVHQTPFPIAGLTHSVTSNINALLYIGILLFFNNYDVVIATSAAGRRAVNQGMYDTRRYLSERLSCRNVSQPEVVTIPLGIDNDLLSPKNQRQSRLKLGLPEDGIIIEYVGRLTDKHKADLQPLLYVLKRVLSIHPQTYLLIAGSETPDRPSYTAVLDQMARDIGVGHRMIVLKDFPFEQKSTVYSAADVFVSPVDNIQETFGLSILEAMACQLPVVASDWSGYRDIVANGESGFLVRTIWNNQAADWVSHIGGLWGDDLEISYFLAQNTVIDTEELSKYLTLLVQNEGLRKEMGRRGRERVLAHFSWRVVVKLYQRLWEAQLKQMMIEPTMERNSRISCNYGSTYGHFASVALQQIANTRLHANVNMPEDRVANSVLPYGVSDSVVKGILTSCLAQSQPIQALLCDDQSDAAYALSWLWKKGYVQRSI